MAICYTNIRFYVWTTEIQAESKTSMCTKNQSPSNVSTIHGLHWITNFHELHENKTGKNVSPAQQLVVSVEATPQGGASNPKLKDRSPIRPAKGYL